MFKIETLKSTVITILLLGITGWLITFGGIKLFKFIQNKMKIAKLISQANAELVPTEITLTPSQINTIVSGLYAAMKGVGTDEEAIYSLFKQIRTRSDLMAVIMAFGERDDKNLAQWLISELSHSEINKLNQILITNKINYSF